MAQKRMFSLSIVGDDKFIEMPLSSQALYFHLGMNADVKGFITPKKVMRLVNAADDDLNVLITKGFVIPFKSGVLVIRHWRSHNNIREEREAPSQYLTEFNSLLLDDNGNYTLDKSGTTPGVLRHSVVECSVDKSRLEESSVEGSKEPIKNKNVVKELDKIKKQLAEKMSL